MPKTLVTLERYCEREGCDNPLPPTDLSNADRRRFCSDKCRYQAWRDGKEQELHKLIKQLAGRIAV